MLQKKIDTQSIKTVRWYSKQPDQAIPMPELGPDLIDPRQKTQIKEYSLQKLVAESQPDQASSEPPAVPA
jgi:NADH-quinone oxidoreductase subunit B